MSTSPSTEKPAASNEIQNPQHWYEKTPGLRMLVSLKRNFGLKFLIMLAICCHWCKGFNQMQINSSLPFLLGDYSVPGPIQDKYASAAAMPWAMKPLIALASDAFPVGGFQKLPYLFVTSVVGAIGFGIILLPTGTFPVSVIVLGVFLGNIQGMTADILAEGIYSRRLAENPLFGPDMVVFVWMGQKATSILSAFVAGLMLEYMEGIMGWTGAQWVMASCLVPTVVVIYPTFMNWFGEERINGEQARENRSNLGRQPELVMIGLLVGFLAVLNAFFTMFVSSFMLSVLFIFLTIVFETVLCATLLRPVIGSLVIYKAIETTLNLSVGGPAYYFYINDAEAYPEGPHFSKFFYVTVLGVISNVVSLLALSAYSAFCSEWTYRKVKALFITGAFFFGLPNLILYSRLNREWGIPDELFVLGENTLQAAMYLLYFMPTFLILSRLCPKNVESTLFAILAATNNFCNSGARSLSGFMCQMFGITPDGSPNETAKFENMWIASLLMQFIKLVPLAFLWLLPPHKQTENIIPPEENTSATEGSVYKKCTGKTEAEVTKNDS